MLERVPAGVGTSPLNPASNPASNAIDDGAAALVLLESDGSVADAAAQGDTFVLDYQGRSLLVMPTGGSLSADNFDYPDYSAHRLGYEAKYEFQRWPASPGRRLD